ncbi:MAG TPA: ParA family protein [Candidatus Solibacter sp.]|nr:ParA family protein [Candidatus Solibacter sp.]
MTIAIVSGKGGTGKTTTAISLACALAERDFSVLAVDMDPQANLTSGLGFNPYDARNTLLEVLSGKLSAGSAVLETEYRVDLLPSSPDFALAESALPSRLGQETALRQALATLTKYDFALVDTPPNFGFHTVNALAAADYILVPVQMSGYALKGLNEVQRAMAAMRVELNPQLEVLGVLPTFVSARTNFSYDILAALRALPDLRIFEAQVRSTVLFAETSLEGVPILKYATRSTAANAYRKLAGEVIDRTGMVSPEEAVLAGVALQASTADAPASAAWPTPAPLSTTGALSVDAARLLGMAPAEDGSDTQPAVSPPGLPAATGTGSGSTRPKIGTIARIRALVRKLAHLKPAA